MVSILTNAVTIVETVLHFRAHSSATVLFHYSYLKIIPERCDTGVAFCFYVCVFKE